jgi:uncharacterized membrane protein
MMPTPSLPLSDITQKIRATALQQALLSYLLGAVILAMTINLIITLAHYTS